MISNSFLIPVKTYTSNDKTMKFRFSRCPYCNGVNCFFDKYTISYYWGYNWNCEWDVNCEHYIKQVTAWSKGEPLKCIDEVTGKPWYAPVKNYEYRHLYARRISVIGNAADLKSAVRKDLKVQLLYPPLFNTLYELVTLPVDLLLCML